MMEKVFATMLLIAGFSSMASADSKNQFKDFGWKTCNYFDSLIEFSVGKWVVKDSNVTCLIVSMSIKVNFTYTTAGERSLVFAKSYFLRSDFANFTIFASFIIMSHC